MNARFLSTLLTLAAAAGACAEDFDFAKDFGGSGDGVSDNSSALAKAAEALEKAPGSSLFVPKGSYVLKSLAKKYCHETFHARLANLKDVSIKGSGAEFVFSEPGHGGLLFWRCERLSVEGLSFDWNPLPFTQGEIAEVSKDNPREFAFRPEHGFPAPDSPNFSVYKKGSGARVIGFVFDAGTRRLLNAQMRDNHKEIAAVERLDGGLFKISLHEASAPDGLAPGRLFAFVQRTPSDCLVFHECDAPSVKDVALYSSSHLGVVFRGSRSPSIDGARLLRKPGTTRLLSTNADGIWMESCYDGPRIENCVLDGVMDDGLVLPIYGRQILARLDSKTYRVKRDWATELRVGDVAEAVDPEGRRSGALPPVARVSASEGNSEAVEFSAAVPELPLNGRIFNLSMANDRFLIRNNKIFNLRGHGVKIHGAGGVVEGNLIDGTAFTGIEAGFQNAGRFWFMWSDNAVIRGNEIRNSSTLGLLERTPLGWATAIRVNLGPDALEFRVNRNIEIAGNKLSNCGQAPIRAWSCEGLKITGNKIDGANLMELPSDRIGVDLINVGRAIVEGNEISAKRACLDAFMRVSPDCDGVVSENNALTFK